VEPAAPPKECPTTETSGGTKKQIAPKRIVDDITFIEQGILSIATVVTPNDDFDGLVTDETSYRDDWRPPVTKRAILYGKPRDDDDDDDDNDSRLASDTSTQTLPTTEGE
jgi:hypothetical protein